MANYATLKAAVNQYIRTNGNKEITGAVLNSVLNTMIDSLGANYMLAGVATPSTNPGTPDQNVAYLAFQAGTYTNFNATVLPDGISLLLWNGSWSAQTFFTIDSEPTAGSDNLVKSGGVYEEIDTVFKYLGIDENDITDISLDGLMTTGKYIHKDGRLINNAINFSYSSPIQLTKGWYILYGAGFQDTVAIFSETDQNATYYKCLVSDNANAGQTPVRLYFYFNPETMYVAISTRSNDVSYCLKKIGQPSGMLQAMPSQVSLEKMINDLISVLATDVESINKSLSYKEKVNLSSEVARAYITTTGDLGEFNKFLLKKYNVNGGEKVHLVNNTNLPASFNPSYAIYSSAETLSSSTLLVKGPNFPDGLVDTIIDLPAAAKCVAISTFNGSTCDLEQIIFDTQVVEKTQKNINDINSINAIIGGNVAYEYDGTHLYLAYNDGNGTEYCYIFQKCLFNELFTFYKVGIRTVTRTTPSVEGLSTWTGITTINQSDSDNIGPIQLYVPDETAQEGTRTEWVGGNHYVTVDNVQVKTAKTLSYSIYADGKEIGINDNGICKNIAVKVVNEFYDPIDLTVESGSLTVKLCDSYEFYNVGKNTIEVAVMLKFANGITDSIRTYYGMQSMFKNETYFITPLGRYSSWEASADNLYFAKGTYPNFNRFIEKSNTAYQSTFLYDKWEGNHSLLPTDRRIFLIGMAKAYHHLIEDLENIGGIIVQWSGGYTFFKNAVLDNDGKLVYRGIINGKDAVYMSFASAYSGLVELPSDFLLSSCKAFNAVNITGINEGDDVSVGAFGLLVNAGVDSSLILVRND